MGQVSFKWLMDPGETEKKSFKEGTQSVTYSQKESGTKAANRLLELIKGQGGGVVYAYFEGSPTSKENLGNNSTNFSKNQLLKFLHKNKYGSTVSAIKSYFNQFPDEAINCGFSRVLTDKDKTFAGELYIKGIDKAGEVYINLSKLIANDDNNKIPEVVFSEKSKGNNSKSFDMKSYDLNSRCYADAFFSTIEELDDRKEIQKKIHGYDWKSSLSWNVTLGDLMFFVPPTNIRLTNIIQNERMPVIRSKGTLAKTDQRIIKSLEIDMYFNEDRGINGYAYTDTMPDGETKITYSMDGFRALESMFRFTPYLPITNDYINRILGIDAVVLTNITVSSVPNYPKLLKSTIIMKEFNWQVYMPDIVQLQQYGEKDSITLENEKHNEEALEYLNKSEDEKERIEIEEKRRLTSTEEFKKYEQEKEQKQTIIESEYRNWFAMTFNWKLFRYYYQRPIIRGDMLRSVNWDFNSDAYISATCGAKTSYIPMKFDDTNIKFYLVNESYLKKLLNLKFNIKASDIDAINFNDRQIETLQNLAKIGSKLNSYSSSEKTTKLLKEINELLVDSIAYGRATDRAFAGNYNNSTNSNGQEQYGEDAGDIIDEVTYINRETENQQAEEQSKYYSFSHASIYDGSIVNRNQGNSTSDRLSEREYGITFNETAREKIDTILNDIKTILQTTLDKDTFNIDDIRIVRSLNANTGILMFGVSFGIKDQGLSDVDKSSLKNNLSTLYGANIGTDEKYKPDKEIFMEDDRIVIPLICRVEAKEYSNNFYNVVDNASLEFGNDDNSITMKALNNMYDIVKYYTKKNKNGLATNVQVDDSISLLNMKYDNYLGDGILVSSWQASTVNRMAPLRTLSNDCYAPQYLGGEDISISINILTTDKDKVKKLANLPIYISRIARKYHSVMPYVPLRIDSEFSRLLGVNEVTIEDASINTVENVPGLYTIQMTFLSTDRITREKESPYKGSFDNFGSTYKDNEQSRGAIMSALATIPESFGNAYQASNFFGVTTKADSEQGKTDKAMGVDNGIDISPSYFKVKQELAKVDLYPDLELPKISELKNLGYDFVRYKFEDYRTFVDPDFYFVYPVGLTSQLYRELVVYGMDRHCINNLAETKIMDDNTGALTMIKPMFAMGYTVDNDKSNGKFEEELEKLRKENKAKEEMAKKARQERAQNIQEKEDNSINLTSRLDSMMEKEKWDICTEICCMFLERRYLKEIQSYEARLKSNTIGNKDENLGSSNNNNAKEAKEKIEQANAELDKQNENLWSAEDDYNTDANELDRQNKNEKNRVTNDTYAEDLAKATHIPQDKYTEGAYHYNFYKTAENEINDYIDHLKENSPYDEDPRVEQFAEALKDHDYSNVSMYNGPLSYAYLKAQLLGTNSVEKETSAAVDLFLSLSSVKKLFKGLSIDIENSKFVDLMRKIVFAAACAATAPKEYIRKENSQDWKPDGTYMGTILELGQGANRREIRINKPGYIKSEKEKSEEQETNNYVDETLKKNIAAIRDNGTEFGIFKIPLLKKQKLINLLSPFMREEEIIPSEIIAETKDDAIGIHFDNLLMDPYYRNNGIKVRDIKNYKESCSVSYFFSTIAFLRVLTYWLCILVKLKIYPGLVPDQFYSLNKFEKSVENTQNAYVPGSGNNAVGGKVNLQRYIDFYSNNRPSLDSGKIFVSAIMALCDGDNNILGLMKKRDYPSLNATVRASCIPTRNIDAKYNFDMLCIRKMLFALIGLGVIKDYGKIGINKSSPAIANAREAVERLYLKAAEDPSQYIPHSFHDMVTNDARGRMLRAFPTFYMIFIDEGRQYGYWKLHDNFYHINSIASIEVVKSRKIPADTCRIVMSNFYNSYSTEMLDEHNLALQSSFSEAFDSIFSPSKYAYEQEIKRIGQDNTNAVSSATANPDSKIGISENYNASIQENQRKLNLRLRTGTRIHIRMGYGNNANMVPIVFNGVIAEMSSESAVEIIAQGDGIELMNPIFKEGYVENQIVKSDNFLWNFADGATPLEIAVSLFSNYGGVIRQFVKQSIQLNLCDRNPFGIVHFGDPDFRLFISTGECTQNLYEACSTPINGLNTDVKSDAYNMGVFGIKNEEVPSFTFDVFQKTPWDILNICKSTMPNFIVGIAPFGFRSTCFMGMPHYYYCYDYYRDVDGITKEKRKPYQQWHVYTSESDIIDNKIVASARDMKTVALGLYSAGSAGASEQKSVGPLFADWDIYKELQKTMIVDTNLLARGVPLAGKLPLIGWLVNEIHWKLKDWFADDKGIIQSDKKLAWKQTASALRESIMDMYNGSLVLIGDPSVKPHDRIYISDSYTGLNGQALVKDVTMTLSIENGFTTVITPDCITCINDNTEIMKSTSLERIGCFGTVNSDIVQENVNSNFKHMVARTIGFNISGTAIQGLTSILTKGTTKAAEESLKKLGIKALSGFSNICVPIRIFTAMYSLIASPMLNAFLYDELKNNKVITIFPLKKYGHVYTAGFDGARGSVYGSPTWGDRGTFGDMFDWIDDKFGFFNNISIGGKSLGISVADLFLDEDVIEQANRFRKSNVDINKQGSIAAMENEYGRLLSKLNGDEYGYLQSNYRSQQITPRIDYSNSAQVLNALRTFAMYDVGNYRSDPRFKEVKLISQDARIMPYIDDQFFSIVHDNPTLAKNYREEIITTGNKEYRTKAIITNDGKGNDVLDLPMLNEDAMNILYEILRRTKNNMPNANSSDVNENWESTKNDYIVLKSALRIGDKESIAATGFNFIIQATNTNSQRALKNALETLDAEFKSDTAKELGLQTDIFFYKQNEKKEISVTVTMPVTRAYETAEKLEEEIEDTKEEKE